jgi:excisionase family DNA binding protein
MTAESLWTAMDVATYLAVSKSWVYLHAEAGDLPSLRFGGVVRFDPAAIRAFARGEKQPGTTVVAFPARGR